MRCAAIAARRILARRARCDALAASASCARAGTAARRRSHPRRRSSTTSSSAPFTSSGTRPIPQNAPGPRPLADAVVLQHRRGRLRPHRVRHRRGARLGDARGRPRSARCATLQFLLATRSRARARGRHRLHGFYYHFLDMKTRRALRDRRAVDDRHPLLLAGVLFCQSYFDRDDADRERRSARTAETLYARVEWTWAQARPPRGQHGLDAGGRASTTYDWRGYNEAMILYVLALGSPTHPVEPRPGTSTRRPTTGATFYGQEYVHFAPLFGHQYSHVWIDFRGIQDAYMRAHGHRLLRELAPRHARAARLRDRQPERLDGLRRRTSGASPPATARWTRRSRSTARPRTFYTLRRARRGRRRRPRRRHDRADRRRRLDRLRARDRDPGACARCATTTATNLYHEVRLPRRVQPDAARRRRTLQARHASIPARLVRHRLPRHRPGPDRGDDREPPQRAGLEDDAEESAHRPRAAARRLHRRLAGATATSET